jgi:hypothetical protein
MKVYFINSKEKKCGVYQYGLRLWNAIKKSEFDINYFEIENETEFNNLDFKNVDIIFFNWIEGGQSGPFGWYTHSLANKIKNEYNITTITVKHTNSIFSTAFDYVVDQDPASGLPRPLYEWNELQSFNSEIINIGSFGFAGPHKGFDQIIKLVNEQFDEAIINLNITNAFYGDKDGVGRDQIIKDILSIPRKENVKLNLTTDFMNNEELLQFVSKNDLLVFAYRNVGDISSVVDYAISVNKPIAVTNIDSFRHVYKKEIDIDLCTLTDIITYNKNSEHVLKLKEKWSSKNLMINFEKLLNEIYNQTNEKSYSQVCQDRFVLKLIGRNGFFFDLGAGWDHSRINSNTLLLEEYGWDGISIDGNMDHATRRNEKSIRSTTIVCKIPETTIKEILDEQNAPKIIDYVSIDIEPVSMIGLENFPFDDYEFKVLTFEHDSYVAGQQKKEESYKLLTEKGFIRLCDNVRVPESMGPNLYFEDWWINPKYFSKEFIENNTFEMKLGSYIVSNIKTVNEK